MTRSQTEVAQRIEQTAVLPVLRLGSPAFAERAVSALLDGGITVFEVTLTIPGALGVIGALGSRLGDRALIGAGTVLTADEARACLDAGAHFIVSPGLDAGVVAAAHDRDVVVIPGALTPTEVMAATAMGADFVKIFPCSAVGGAKYVRALRAPFPHVKLVPTGGVTAATAVDYLDAGATAIGLGSDFVNDKTLEQPDGDEVLAERARQVIEAIRARRVGPS
ncbi:MAG: bifunctional 4-hydroxy-2-oxoglutarate aldolase/2-dehydro-3-deoxy-phosphogluconate aldolase [Polyangiaceae bacterium]|nr:bifunctional 4-hydroxy-2-oxoglutarate aldolase/2-dehydro-3-deoxy-phosphogluconate aldolase [Polyangiaceae bacterium]